MHIHLHHLLIVCGVIFILSGCKAQGRHSEMATGSAAALVSSNHCFTAITNWQQAAKVNEYFEFDLTLNESCVASSDIAAVSLYADMPAHGHGTNNQPVVKKVAPFIYRIEGVLLHMPGDWRITLEVTYMHQNQISMQQQLEVISFNATL